MASRPIRLTPARKGRVPKAVSVTTRMLKAFVHPANEHEKWGGQALLLGMDLSSWPRVRKVFVDWGYRGLEGLAPSLGLELGVVARPYAGCRRFRGRGVQAFAQAVGGGADLCLAWAEPAAVQGLRSAARLPCAEPPGERGLGVLGHATLVRETAGQGRVASVEGFYDSL